MVIEKSVEKNGGTVPSRHIATVGEEAVVVKDAYRLALIIVGILGFAALLPFNLYATATGYYEYQLRDRATSKPSQLALAYESTLTVVNAVVGLLFSILNTYLTARISFKRRINFALTVMVILYGFSAIITIVPTDTWQAGFFTLTMGCLIFAGATGSIVSSAALGVASILPPVYITSVLLGMGLAGVFTSVASIIAIAVSESVIAEGLIYFLIATAASVAALALFLVFNRLPFVQHHIYKKNAKNKDDFSAIALTVKNAAPREAQLPSSSTSNSGRLRQLFTLFRIVWPYCLSMALTFFVTLIVFPAIMARVVGRGTLTGLPGSASAKYFIPIYTFLVFNVGDVVGRYAFELLRFPRFENKWTPLTVNLLAVARLGFIPLILLCNVQPRGSNSSVVFGDVWFLVFCVLLAFSNGYIKNLSSMYPPQIAPTELMETCGSLLITAMYVGILAGGASSFLLLYIVQII